MQTVLQFLQSPKDVGPFHAIPSEACGTCSKELKTVNMDVSEHSGTPKSSILIGFSIIFTIHFGGVSPLFLETPIIRRSIYFS